MPPKVTSGQTSRGNSRAPPSGRQTRRSQYIGAPSSLHGSPAAGKTSVADDAQISYSLGSVLDVPEGSVIVHSCNISRGWGAGVAKNLAKEFPLAKDMEDEHRDRYKDKPAEILGTCLLIPPQEGDTRRRKAPGRRHSRSHVASGSRDKKIGECWIACLYVKEAGGHPGSDNMKAMLLVNFAKALNSLKEQLDIIRSERARPKPCDLFCPPVNSGLFGIPWEITAELLQRSGLNFTVKYMSQTVDPRTGGVIGGRSCNKLRAAVEKYCLERDINNPLSSSAQRSTEATQGLVGGSGRSQRPRQPTSSPSQGQVLYHRTQPGRPAQNNLRDNPHDTREAHLQVTPPRTPERPRTIRNMGPRAATSMLLLGTKERETAQFKRNSGDITESMRKEFQAAVRDYRERTFALESSSSESIKTPSSRSTDLALKRDTSSERADISTGLSTGLSTEESSRPAEDQGEANIRNIKPVYGQVDPRPEAYSPNPALAAIPDVVDLLGYPQPRLSILQGDKRYTLHPVASTSESKIPEGMSEEDRRFFGAHMKDPSGRLRLPEEDYHKNGYRDARFEENPFIEYDESPKTDAEKRITGKEEVRERPKDHPEIPDIPGVPRLLLAEKFNVSEKVKEELRLWTIYKNKRDEIKKRNHETARRELAARQQEAASRPNHFQDLLQRMQPGDSAVLTPGGLVVTDIEGNATHTPASTLFPAAEQTLANISSLDEQQQQQQQQTSGDAADSNTWQTTDISTPGSQRGGQEVGTRGGKNKRKTNPSSGKTPSPKRQR